MQNYIYYNWEKISFLIFQFNNLTEIILKLSVKSLSASKENEDAQMILSFIELLVTENLNFLNIP